ncbi:MAG: hypothetical protein G01um101470_101 [Parcubacteria group bacterium Gr01-1014_70]|nr:MAG: hypothetical protein G01um101470_101 [Parcubacteria group bacterium Gr01-1014_70]
MKHLLTKNAPEPGFYSQAVCVDVGDYTLVLLAGQTGNVPGIKDEPVIAGGLGPQTMQTLQNIVSVVEAAGGDISNVVELKVFLKDSEAIGDARQKERTEARKTFGAAYTEFFTKHGYSQEAGNLPARTMVWVSEVPLEYPAEDTLVEITAMAVIPKK